MHRILSFWSFFFLCNLLVHADGLDEIRQALESSSSELVQEKVWLHTDNTCYFVGDTLWFKGYVVRADNLQPTDMSRILYVELLSPDGLLVERQTIIVSPNGHTCGQFVLQDSLYSGYYELRAYTRWMLNFNVRHHHYSTTDKWAFFSKQMAADFYRIWDGLYSRVLPVYGKPEQAGNYDARRMYQRPKTRIPKPKKEKLLVTFYPEGGHLVKGVENRVAFEAVNQLGEAVNVKGTVSGGGNAPFEVKTEYMGRGSFLITPGSSRPKAVFSWQGKDYSFDLPKVEDDGVAVRLDGDQLILTARLRDRHDASPDSLGLSVLCRGALQHFSKWLPVDGSSVVQRLPLDDFPTGVNNLTVFNAKGQILADRLFFVNHHDQDGNTITAPIVPTKTFRAYERVELPVQLEGVSGATTFSLSVRDTYTDEPSYDDGNIMTDLLLSSELRGFIARPAYYFERDDEQHRRHLDLLMMVQGWRKYNWHELADAQTAPRYQPEKGLTVEGQIYKMLPINEVEADEIPSWLTGVGMVGVKAPDLADTTEDPFADNSETEETTTMTDIIGTEPVVSDFVGSTIDYGTMDAVTSDLRTFRSSIRGEVLVEAEIVVGRQVVGSVQKTQDSRYMFTVPPFYGDGYLNMKAYKESDSIKKNMASRKDAHALDEDAWPDYYVKRDLPYPVFTRPYGYYEDHQPDVDTEMLVDTLSDLSMENDVHELGNVTVKGKRRGRRGIDWKKPAFVMDAYEVYNELTDRGLSYGKLDMRLFPVQVARLLYGNMNRYRMFHVDGRMEGYTYYRNYSPFSIGSAAETSGMLRANRTPQWYLERLKLKRLQDIRVYSDYEPRKEDSTLVEGITSADATVDLVPIPDDGRQPTFRDRHILFHGFNYPETFYQPDYSSQQPEQPTDYRRTLYWNPNAVTDDEGRFTAVFFNNSKDTRIRMTAASVTADGRLLHGK